MFSSIDNMCFSVNAEEVLRRSLPMETST